MNILKVLQLIKKKMFQYKKENVSGYLDNQGKDIGITFEETRNVYDGLSWVKKDGKWGLYKVTK